MWPARGSAVSRTRHRRPVRGCPAWEAPGPIGRGGEGSPEEGPSQGSPPRGSLQAASTNQARMGRGAEEKESPQLGTEGHASVPGVAPAWPGAGTWPPAFREHARRPRWRAVLSPGSSRSQPVGTGSASMARGTGKAGLRCRAPPFPGRPLRTPRWAPGPGGSELGTRSTRPGPMGASGG